MCGRYALWHFIQELIRRFTIDYVDYMDDVPEISYNIAPSEPILVVTEADGARRLEAYRWGLVPSWATDPAIGNRLINARAETITEKPSYRNAFASRRCLIPADGFFEWMAADTSVKKPLRQPMYITRPDRELFAFAGIWDEWIAPDGSPLRSCAIITVNANQALSPIHNRMPAILDSDSEATWLDKSAKIPDLLSLLHPAPDNALEAYPVSSAVNSALYKEASCIAPATAQAREPATLSLFD